jgi:hypothetical protein
VCGVNGDSVCEVGGDSVCEVGGEGSLSVRYGVIFPPIEGVWGRHSPVYNIIFIAFIILLNYSMTIVLVMLNNFQEYILDNITHLINFKNTTITLITDFKFRNRFESFSSHLTIINIEDLIPHYATDMQDTSSTFRNGFWKLTTYRFYAIQAYMEKYNITNIVHIENDVLVYKNLNELIFHDTSKLLLTMDAEKRCIPGLMFIPNHTALKYCLQRFNPDLNDMENWAACFYQCRDRVDTLPIFISDPSTPCREMITRHFDKYQAIFDAAAMGQYLGGIDSCNTSANDTIGFVNETCVFNYSTYKFLWKKNENNLVVPYILINDVEYPIINLHIHCKNLKKFITMKVKYKFIMLVLSSSNLNNTNGYFTSSEKYSQLKIMNKMYYDLYPNDIKFFYMENDPNLPEQVIEKNDYIYVRAEETVVPGMLIKQQEAVKSINTKYDYDYIILTNLSTLWNIPVLLSLYKTIPRTRFFGGHLPFNTFVSGTGIFISHDLTPLLMQANRHETDNNDVVISRHMNHSNVTTYMLNNLSQFKMNYQILDETVTDKESPHHVDRNPMPETTDDILYFRIRNATIERDLYITKFLIHKLYHL